MIVTMKSKLPQRIAVKNLRKAWAIYKAAHGHVDLRVIDGCTGAVLRYVTRNRLSPSERIDCYFLRQDGHNSQLYFEMTF